MILCRLMASLLAMLMALTSPLLLDAMALVWIKPLKLGIPKPKTITSNTIPTISSRNVKPRAGDVRVEVFMSTITPGPVCHSRQTVPSDANTMSMS